MRNCATTKAGRMILLVAGLALLVAGGGAGGQESGLQGVWDARIYRLASGEHHEVRGRLFFQAGHWQVLFFVLGPDGRPHRGSGEGGSYELEGERLTFRHELNLTYGVELPGLPAVGPRMTVRDAAEAAAEPARVRIDGDTLEISFPSGNILELVRAS